MPPVLLLADLSSAQKAGLAGMGAAFIIFALVSSFLLPRWQPNFPGKHMWAYIAVVACFFVGMMSVVIFVAKEPPEASATPTQPSPAPSPAPGSPPAPTPPTPVGNAAAGKAVFAANGCASCHTFRPAGAAGTVGPDLDNLAADARTANRGPLDKYTTESIVDPNAYVVPKFPAGVMPQDFAMRLSKQQVADLVAFLTQPQ